MLLSEPSATRTLPDWPWRTLINPTVHLRTWATRQARTRTVVSQAMETLCRTACTPVTDLSTTAADVHPCPCDSCCGSASVK